jgi:membrane associated rhomboid family serine protease
MDVLYFEAPARGGPGIPPSGGSGYRPAPEPLVNAPWPVVALVGGILVLYLLQSQFPIDRVSEAFGFSPARLAAGEPQGLVSSQFVHGNWAHALMNAGFILAFGAPVSRYFGPRLSGAVVFFLFYLGCGVLACLGFALLHWGQPASLIGASGAASGLMGAASRLIAGQGRVGPLASRIVVSMAASWVAVNVVMAYAGGLLIPGAGKDPISWEAHLFGFAAGALLIPAFGWLAGRRRS